MTFKDRMIEQLESSKEFLLYKANTAKDIIKKQQYGTEAIAVCKSLSNLLTRGVT